MARPYVRRKPQEEPAVSETEDLRPEPRPDLRDDPRARAVARAAELRGHLGNLDEGQDDFYVDPSMIPDGWSYEWKRRTNLGAEDPAYQVAIRRTGWDPVPANRHPSFMPDGYSGKTIERKGMVLMERPKEITDEVNSIERKKARQQVQAKEDQLNAAPAGTFERVDGNKRSAVKIAKSYEPIAIPD